MHTVVSRSLNAVILSIAFVVASINAQAHEFERFVTLSGSTGARGSGIVTFDLDLVTMRVQLDFTGLSSNTLSSHIHATTPLPLSGTAPIATTNFFTSLSGVTSGTFDQTYDLALAGSYDAAFITSSGGLISNGLSALINAAENEQAYLSIKTVAFPTGNGEISGFLTAVPEPSSLALLGAVVSLIAICCRNKR